MTDVILSCFMSMIVISLINCKAIAMLDILHFQLLIDSWAILLEKVSINFYKVLKIILNSIISYIKNLRLFKK